MLLDDDDYLSHPDVIFSLMTFASFREPDCIIARMRRPDRVVPDDSHWRKLPFRSGHIGMPCLIMRRDVYQSHAELFCRPVRADYSMASHLHRLGMEFAWFDQVVTIVPVVSHGNPEGRHVL